MDIATTQKIVARQLAPTYATKLKTIYLRAKQKRSFHAYCVGTAKSGTHSLAAMFDESFRAAHEPQGCLLIYLKKLYLEGNIDKQQVHKVLKQRDVRLNLDLESSDFAGYYIKELEEIFPNSKFILPIRDCYSFLDSIINHQINNPIKKNNAWGIGRDINYTHSNSQFFLKNNPLDDKAGLYSVYGYLRYWADRNLDALNNIPSHKLFALKTGEIKEKKEMLARFLGANPASVSIVKSHSFKAPMKYNMLSKFDCDYIESIVDETGCRDVMKEFYPAIKSMKDANIR